MKFLTHWIFCAYHRILALGKVMLAIQYLHLKVYITLTKYLIPFMEQYFVVFVFLITCLTYIFLLDASIITITDDDKEEKGQFFKCF